MKKITVQDLFCISLQTLYWGLAVVFVSAASGVVSCGARAAARGERRATAQDREGREEPLQVSPSIPAHIQELCPIIPAL